MNAIMHGTLRRLCLLSLTLAAIASAACVGQLIGSSPSARIGPTGSQVPSVGLVAGAPITVSAQTPQVPPGPDGRPFSPVGASGSTILLRSGGQFNSSGPVSYELWNPSTGVQTPAPGLATADAARDRVLAVSDVWAVVTHDETPSGGPTAVELRNLQTGETRQIGTSGDSSNAGRVVSANGWVAWTDTTPNHSGIWLYDIAAGKASMVPAMTRRISDLAVANGVVAWWQSQGFNNSPPRILVRDLAANNLQSVPASGVRSLVLSGDGQTVVWLQDSGAGGAGLFLQDLKTGSSGRLLGGQSVGVSLSVSGQYVSWQPGPGNNSATAGVYNVKTHELRVVQSAPSTPVRISRVMGQWFLWSNGRQAVTAPAGAFSPANCCYLLPLPN